jgi:hypothetical protein
VLGCTPAAHRCCGCQGCMQHAACSMCCCCCCPGTRDTPRGCRARMQHPLLLLLLLMSRGPPGHNLSRRQRQGGKGGGRLYQEALISRVPPYLSRRQGRCRGGGPLRVPRVPPWPHPQAALQYGWPYIAHDSNGRPLRYRGRHAPRSRGVKAGVPCSSGAGRRGFDRANPDAQNAPSFRRWRFEA